MKSPTFAGLALLEEIATEHNMHGRGEALAVAIGKDTILGIALARELLRAYAEDAFVSACVTSVRELYPSVSRKTELIFPKLSVWQDYLPGPAELEGAGVLGFVYDFWPRCYHTELRGFWARTVYGYLFLYTPSSR